MREGVLLVLGVGSQRQHHICKTHSNSQCCILLVAFLLASERTFIAKYENKLSAEAEERNRELAKKVAQATFQQMEAHLKLDMSALKEFYEKGESATVQTALDMKYLKERQRFLGTTSVLKFSHRSDGNREEQQGFLFS